MPCQGCNNSKNGVMREECASNYRRCQVCVKVTVSRQAKAQKDFVYNNEEAKIKEPEAVVALRLQPPSPDDRIRFEQLVSLTTPTPLRNVTSKAQYLSLMSSYGTAEERQSYHSSMLLEMTLDDHDDTINDVLNTKKRDLRGLRFRLTTSGDPILWWINSNLLNDYVELVNAKSVGLALRAHCFSPHFLERFALGYADVKRWSVAACKRHSVTTIFGLERLIVPLNLANQHWLLMVAHMRQRRIVYYDSIKGYDANGAMEKMKQFHK